MLNQNLRFTYNRLVSFFLVGEKLYHRQRIYFSSTLSCNKKEEKNHQTSHFELVRPLQSTKQLWAHAPTSINQATLSTCAHFNQPSNFEHMRPPPPHLTTLSLGPPSSTCLNSWLHPPPTHQGQMDPHTPPPLLSMVSSDAALWPRYGHLVISQTVRRKSRSQWSILQFMNRLNCEEICIQKFSCFSAGRGHFLLACLLGCL
jgi:hypothetical protein